MLSARRNMSLAELFDDLEGTEKEVLGRRKES